MQSQQQITKNGLLPTPPRPKDLPAVELTENARQVLIRRYVRRGDDGKPCESVEDMFWRVAFHVAKVEEQWGSDVMSRAREFYVLLTSKKFFPNSPTFTGAGTPLGQLAACFVLPINDDMGRDPSGIFQTLRDAALIQQTGGGNGFSFSRLRPKGSMVKSSAGQATGPVGFLRVYDHAFGEIAQGGTRRGANMAVLRVDHPDVEDFITCKTDENAITNFNISVGITDDFMRAVENDEEWELRFPDVHSPLYRQVRGTLEQLVEAGVPLVTYKKVRARELFDKIVRQAHHNGEPGVLFLDAANRSNPVPHLYPLEATNPCFTGDTRIPTDIGLLTIAELAEIEQDLFIATDNRALQGERVGASLGVALRPASPAWKTREKTMVYRLQTQAGFQLTATPDHRFLTPSGYVSLENLKVGDKVLLQSGEGPWSRNVLLPLPQEFYEVMSEMAHGGNHVGGQTVQRADFKNQYSSIPKHWSRDLGVVMGVLVGDGWFTENSHSPLGICFSEDEVQKEVYSILSEWFGAGHLHSRGEVVQLTYGRLPYLFFKSLGVSTAKSSEKCVPSTIWSAPREVVIGFLQGLFSADGSVQVNSKKQDCTVRLASSSLKLLQEVQILLINLGIFSSIHQRRKAGKRLMPDGRGDYAEYSLRDQYELIIGKQNRDRFAQKIGFLQTQKQDLLVSYVKNKKRSSNRELFLDKIAKIEEAGLADVYDLTQPDTHSLIANGIVAHNCGEQWLGPYENCCLGSVNLAQHFAPDGKVDWETLRQSVITATHFLDDVVEANQYVPAVPQLKEAAHRARRIGLGIMGLADLMYHCGVRYGSPEGQEFAAQVMEFVRYHAMVTSVEMAKERGPFPAIKGSIYDADHMRWSPPKPLTPYERDWGRPMLDWEWVVDQIRAHGIRNAAQTTIAPTGTIATVAGCEGYGCEPAFALAYIRHVNDNGKDLQLTYASPQFEQALIKAGIEPEKRQEIIEQVMLEGSCQQIEAVPEEIKRVFVVSGDITAEEHVRMQAAMQAFVDNSLSKTINFPEGATVEDVATAYQLAWKLGCKGITVYVTGSREKVVLETLSTAKKKQAGGEEEAPQPVTVEKPEDQLTIWHETKKPRPRYLTGFTYSIDTPLGKAFITVNENGGSQPFEVFINTAKAGSDTAAVSEAIGRLLSYILRLASPIEPARRLREAANQLLGIGGGRSLGFGPNRVRSLPDGVGQILDEYLQIRAERMVSQQDKEKKEQATPGNGHRSAAEKSDTQPVGQKLLRFGDLCPECGEAAVINEEGCRKCYACGYSEC